MSVASTELAENRHHVVGGSNGGTENEEWNHLLVPVSRHTKFHRWAENITPEKITRLIALLSIGTGDRCVPPSVMKTINEITTIPRWSNLYVPEATESLVTMNAIEKGRRVARNTATQLLRERLYIEQSINAIENGGNFPIRSTKLLQECLPFFKTKSPLEALKEFYSEDHRGKLIWVQAMREHTRGDILASVESNNLVTLNNRMRREFLRLLKEQLYYVGKHHRAWENERKSYSSKWRRRKKERCVCRRRNNGCNGRK